MSLGVYKYIWAASGNTFSYARPARATHLSLGSFASAEQLPDRRWKRDRAEFLSLSADMIFESRMSRVDANDAIKATSKKKADLAVL